jgi:hypothetical protein
MGSNYFRFFDVDIAEAVTVTGQVVIRWIANDINTYLNRCLKTNNDYIIASDTDSVYIDVTKIANSFKPATRTADPQKMVDMLHVFASKDPAAHRPELQGHRDYFNVALPCMSMVRDVIADNCIWTGKKHYA